MAPADLVPPPRPSTRAENLKGAGFMLAGGLSFSIGYGVIKLVVEQVPAAELSFLRHLVGSLLFVPLFVQRGPAFFRTSRLVAHGARAFFGFAGFFLLVIALERMAIADAVALSFTSPIWAFVLAAVVMRERPGWRRTLAVIVGFGGVLLIVRPTAGAFQFAALFALASAASASISMAAVKNLTRTEPPNRIAFYFMIWGVVFAIVPAVFDWHWPSLALWPAIFAIGMLSWIGQLLLTHGFALGDYTKMVPLDYVRIPIAALTGIVFFGETPDPASILGTAIIVASSIYILVARAGPAAKS